MRHDSSLRAPPVAFLLVISVMALAPPALAATPQEQAQEYFEKGAALYFEGEYGEALVQFKNGNATVPNALFLYNIALCHLKLHRYDEALTSARDARAMGSLGEREATLNDSRIAAILTRQRTTQAAREIAERHAVASNDPVAATDADLETTAPPPESSRWGTVGWLGVGATAIGGGLLGAALATELALQPKWTELEAAGASGDTERHAELGEEIEPIQTRGMIFLFSGAGLTAVGVTLMVVELLTPGDTADHDVAFGIGPDGSVGASALWRF